MLNEVKVRKKNSDHHSMHIQAFSPLCKECVVIVNPQLHSGPLHLNGDHYHKTYTEKKPNSLNNS